MPPTLDPAAVLARCARTLAHHGPERPAAILSQLAQTTDPNALPDVYGEGALINDFEREIADLLGKEAAVFMPSGTMAQQIALRIWADRRGPRHVAFHPLCHLEQHEEKGYQLLHDLHAILLGSPHQLITTADLEAIAEPISALLLELPQRDIGGQLPSFDDLTRVVDLARSRGAAVHLDGARLWETRPFYARSYADIAALFDSVYVSLYKTLGAIAGCILAGPAWFIAEARVWQRRHGGAIVQLYPYVLSARAGMLARLDKIPTYVEKARTIAARLAELPEIEIVPNPPHVNMMHLHLRGDRDRLVNAALEVSNETGTWLFKKLRPTSLPSRWVYELTVGDAALTFEDDEIVQLFRELLARARA
jgi:threonine aldolase